MYHKKNHFHGKKPIGTNLKKNAEFINKISKIYRKIALKQKWKIVNASQSKEDVHQEIMKIFSKKIGL